VQTVTAVSATDTLAVKSVTATCPTGTVMTGGGVRWVPTSPVITLVASFPQGGGWFVEANGNGATFAWELDAFALCAGS
jgi:hypothetical protein